MHETVVRNVVLPLIVGVLKPEIAVQSSCNQLSNRVHGWGAFREPKLFQIPKLLCRVFC